MLNSRFIMLLSLVNKSDSTSFLAFRREHIYINKENEILTLAMYSGKDLRDLSRRTTDIPKTIKKQISVKTAIKLGLLL